jgi:hypothetical protein
MNTDSDAHTSSMNVSNQSLLSELWENTVLIAMYSLGTLLLALVWWFLGFVYVSYCIFSIILYMALFVPTASILLPAAALLDIIIVHGSSSPGKGKTFGPSSGIPLS